MTTYHLDIYLIFIHNELFPCYEVYDQVISKGNKNRNGKGQRNEVKEIKLLES